MIKEKPADFKILNVNDEETARYVVSRMLTRVGFQVIEAASGYECLEKANTQPDLVILDVKLPDISGFEVCRRLKADPSTASIPVLHTSATFVTSDKRVQGLEGGADAYLAQPFEAVELVATVKALLRTRAAEERSKRAAAEWEATFDAIRDGVVVVDRTGAVLRKNAAFKRMFASENADRAAFLTTLDPTAAANVEEAIARCESIDVEALAGERWLRVRVDCNDPEAERVVVVADVTAKRRDEQALRERTEALAEQDRRKDEFLAMLAHELRNPLSAIGTAVHLLGKNRKPGDETAARLGGVLERQSRHLGRLVDDLLEVSRITQGKIVLQKQPLDLRDVVLRALESTKLLFDARRQTVSVQMPSGPIVVDADVTRMEQVLSNLLNNAAKYSEPGRPVAVAVAVAAGEARIEVVDQGVGIDESRLESVFDLFVQEDQSLSRSMGGLGIGLTIARELITLHGGRLTVESAGRGMGSTFCIHLPLATDLPAAAEEPKRASVSSTRRRVLVVEDNADTLEMMLAMLEAAGHTVTAANDGVTGLELALTTRPEVALVDIGLPGLDGYQIAERIRRAEAGRNIYLVAVTGYGRAEDRRAALVAGFDTHVVKPIDPDRLLALVERLRGSPSQSGDRAQLDRA